MLTPEYLAGLPEPILRLWDDAEREILRDMARRISTYDYWIPAADYQAERLIAAGHTRDEILAVLAKTTRKTEKELRQMMMEAGSRCLREDVAVYQAAGLKTPLIRESKALTEILNSGYRHTLGTMQNITRTTARTATRQFEDALDLAWSQVSSGAFDAGSAIRQAVKQLCQQGVEAVEYPSGHKDTIETAVRRAVLTGVNQTAAKLQEELADEVGCDLVEVSAHAGARPEHAEWQGKIYSRSGKSEKYPDFRSSTGYGTGAGLCCWNCRHTFGLYIEGSPRVWTDEKLEELSAPKYEYQGEKFTEYEARQKEKYFDRQITRWRREAEAMKAAGQDPAEARAKVKAWERRKSDFVLNRSALLSSKNEDKIFDIVSPFKNVSFSTLTVEEAQEHINQAMTLLEKETEKMDEPYGLVFGYQCHTAPVKVDRTSRIPFSYHADVDAVVVNPFHDYFAKYDFSGAMLHELAHRYDWTVVCSWKNEGIKNALTAAKEYATIHVEELKTIVSQHLDDFPAQDLVSIISDRAVNTTAAHNKLSYSSEVREAFADLASMRAFNASSYHNISKIFPDVTATFEKIFNGDD